MREIDKGIGKEKEGGRASTKVTFSRRMRDLGFTTEKIDKVTYLCRAKWKVLKMIQITDCRYIIKNWKIR